MADLLDHMRAQGAIAFHLGFAEPLIGSRFVEKPGAGEGIGADIRRLAS
jgi:hypothetical protein